MGINDAVSKLGMTEGSIQKAKIYVMDLSERADNQNIKNLESVALNNMKDMSFEKRITDYKWLADRKNVVGGADALRSALAASGVSGNAINNIGTETAKNFLLNSKQRCFEVQFNPSTISLSGYGGGNVLKTSYDQNGGSLSYAKADVHIDFGVQLIFDQVDRTTAFLDGAREVTLSRAVDAGVGAVKNKLNPDQTTVKQQVEAFAALVRNEATRAVTFSWGPLLYSGIVTRINTKYTMFDIQGDPVRATVDFNMICVDSTVNPGSMGTWEDNYKRAFDDDKEYKTGGDLLSAKSWINL